MLNKPLKELSYTVFDTETTGLSPIYSRIIEIAAVKIQPNLLIDKTNSYCTLINPECKISYESFKVHGISDEMVKNQPKMKDIIHEFNIFTKDTILVAHNAKFDMGFINKALDDYKVKKSYIDVLDSIKVAKKAFPKLKSYSLDNLISTLDIKLKVKEGYRHRALYDTLHTAQIFINAIYELEVKGINYFYDL